jgi:hypothetical protein
LKVGNRCRTDEICALQIHVNDAIEFFLRRCCGVTLAPHTGSVDHRIDSSERFDDLLNCCTTLCNSSDIADHIDYPTSRGMVKVDIRSSPTSGNEALQRCIADSTSAASDQQHGFGVIGGVLA